MYTQLIVLGVSIAIIALLLWLEVRYIPNAEVGIVEKLWSMKGSLGDGELVALHGEAGFQPEVLRSGLHFAYWRWQYSVHTRPLITIKPGMLETFMSMLVAEKVGGKFPQNANEIAVEIVEVSGK